MNIHINDAALKHFKSLLQDQPDNTGIRIFVTNPGTPQAECGVAYCQSDQIDDSDVVLNYDGFNAYIAAEEMPYLEEASIEMKGEGANQNLTLRAPYARAERVNSDAPLYDQVAFVIATEINPELQKHHGEVQLVEITEAGVAVLQFGGGCQGCGMVDITLKQGIEDATDHAAGEHPYA